jgi:hypothetical protein
MNATSNLYSPHWSQAEDTNDFLTEPQPRKLSHPPADGVAYAPDITVWLHPASKAIIASSAIVLNARLFMASLIDDWMRDARLGCRDDKPYAGDIAAWDVRPEEHREQQIVGRQGLRTAAKSGTARTRDFVLHRSV